ncbi:MAG: hypothetical protein HYW78_03000 [Parcubacteria group bacterium]|nr:hypothetical protein [Parcubacteria group bacterium]
MKEKKIGLYGVVLCAFLLSIAIIIIVITGCEDLAKAQKEQEKKQSVEMINRQKAFIQYAIRNAGTNGNYTILTFGKYFSIDFIATPDREYKKENGLLNMSIVSETLDTFEKNNPDKIITNWQVLYDDGDHQYIVGLVIQHKSREDR